MGCYLLSVDSRIARVHSDNSIPADFAEFPNAMRSEGENLMRIVSVFASPFGSFGRPIFELFCLCGTKIDVDER
jgi:hypothetical protein